MKTTPKIILSICAFFVLIGIAFIYQLNSDAFETYKTYDDKFQVVKYQRYIRTGGVSVTLKNEETNEKIQAPVNDDCQYQPINKIISLTVRETRKEFFGLFTMRFNTITSGPVCM
jgi:hypothetical protein